MTAPPPALREDELARLAACRSDAEWDAACDAVKAARGGSYPDDWYARVVLSGLAARVVSGFARGKGGAP